MSSANQIVAVIPYFFYSKGDQKDSFKRVPITAKLVTNLLKKAGASHVMIMDPHTPQLEGFFDTPVDALKVQKIFENLKKVVIWKQNYENIDLPFWDGNRATIRTIISLYQYTAGQKN